MTVYIVLKHIDYESSDNEAVFSTLEAAQEYITENYKVEKVSDYQYDLNIYHGVSYLIDKFEVDKF